MSSNLDIESLLATSLPGSRPESVKQLANTARVRETRENDLIFQQGNETPVTLVLRGHGVFRRTTLQGQQVMVGVAYPGGLFGITGVSGATSSVDLVALTNGAVASWRGQELRKVADRDPGLALSIVDRMVLFSTVLTEKLDGFLHQDARRRVVRVLARHRDLFFARPPILTRAHLPALVGTSREMTGRVLRALEREGVVRRVGRTGLKLLDPELLANVNDSTQERAVVGYA